MATRACLSIPRLLSARRCFSSSRAAAADVTHAVFPLFACSSDNEFSFLYSNYLVY